jgi:hypothetical protein
MSFDTLKLSELKDIADEFAVDIEGLKKKSEIVAAISEEGVTWALYQGTLNNKEELEDMTEEVKTFDPNVKLDESSVLVRMTRANFRYDIIGHTFTKEHPFVAMNNTDAQKIFDKEEGFRLATPKEVQEFYS